jgi:carbon-monoxide dehydrogenase medium subunit/2-furoyl-CoA dehydrogenase FAD binding subunit
LKAAAFDYIRPDGLEEVLSVLHQNGVEAKLIAGGQSLVPMMAMRFARPSLLIDINRLVELKHIQNQQTFVHIGAGVRQGHLEDSANISLQLPLIKKALVWVGHRQTRNRGTIGGSLVYADPSAELPLAAMVLGASLHLSSLEEGTRVLLAQDFFLGPMYTATTEVECLTGVDLPVWEGLRVGSAFEESSMRKGDFAMASAACQIQLNDDLSVKRISFGVGGVNGAPTVFPDLANTLIGQRIESSLVKDVAIAALNQCDSSSDIHVSANFRKHLAQTLLRRVVLDAAQEAGGRA